MQARNMRTRQAAARGAGNDSFPVILPRGRGGGVHYLLYLDAYSRTFLTFVLLLRCFSCSPLNNYKLLE